MNAIQYIKIWELLDGRTQYEIIYKSGKRFSAYAKTPYIENFIRYNVGRKTPHNDAKYTSCTMYARAETWERHDANKQRNTRETELVNIYKRICDATTTDEIKQAETELTQYKDVHGYNDAIKMLEFVKRHI